MATTLYKDMLMITYGTKKYKPKDHGQNCPRSEDILFMPYEGLMNPLMTIFINIQGWL